MKHRSKTVVKGSATELYQDLVREVTKAQTLLEGEFTTRMFARDTGMRMDNAFKELERQQSDGRLTSRMGRADNRRSRIWKTVS